MFLFEIFQANSKCRKENVLGLKIQYRAHIAKSFRMIFVQNILRHSLKLLFLLNSMKISAEKNCETPHFKSEAFLYESL